MAYFTEPRGILFLLRWLKWEKAQQGSRLSTRSLATLIEDGMIFVDGIYFCLSRGVCLLSSLGIVTQKEQMC